MTDKTNKNEALSWDYEHYKRDISLLIYRAVPNGEDISVAGPSDAHIDFELTHHVRRVVGQIIVDVLSRGKASWCLCVNPEKGDEGQEGPFCFRPKSDPIRGFKAIPMVIRSRDVGIQGKHVRSLSRRLKHSRWLRVCASFLEYDKVGRAIADRWGHALSWTMSDYSAFTDPCNLLNACDSKLLGIRLCETIEAAMNATLSNAGLSAYRVKIPTYSKEELEHSRQKYVEGKMSGKKFSDLVLFRS